LSFGDLDRPKEDIGGQNKKFSKIQLKM
jgi:hypothetical protein